MRKAFEQKTIRLSGWWGDNKTPDKTINEMLKEGWEYHGTPVYVADLANGKELCQVMVRYEDS